MEAVNHKWLQGSKILSEISEELVEFHSAETVRLTSNDPLQIKQGDLVSVDNRRSIEQLSANFIALDVKGAEFKKFEIFQGRWQRYAIAHNTMVQTTDAGVSRSADFFRPLQLFYADTQRALVEVTDLHTAGAAEEGKSIEAAVETSVVITRNRSGARLLACHLACVGDQEPSFAPTLRYHRVARRACVGKSRRSHFHRVSGGRSRASGESIRCLPSERFRAGKGPSDCRGRAARSPPAGSS